MNASLRSALGALPARQLNLVCIGIVAIAAMLAWSAGVRAPLAAWRQQRAALTALQATAATMATPRTGAVPVAAVGQPPAPPTPLALVGAASEAAKLAGVAVSSAAQGADRPVAGLRQQTVDIVAAGSYPAIQAWLADIERTQPAVGIARLALQPGDTGAQRKVTLQLAIYGPVSAP